MTDLDERLRGSCDPRGFGFFETVLHLQRRQDAITVSSSRRTTRCTMQSRGRLENVHGESTEIYVQRGIVTRNPDVPHWSKLSIGGTR